MSRKRLTLILIVNILVILTISLSTAFAGSNRNFRASLKGRNEVPPVDTNAQGQAILKVSKDETSVDYKLIVANIEDVTQAHIHCGAEGVNGPVVVFLFGFVAGGVDVNGVLSEGSFTNANILPRPDSPECPGGVANLDDLLAKIRSGDAYVNVHTVAWPGGEIRGQLH
jgi:hypothetical protein